MKERGIYAVVWYPSLCWPTLYNIQSRFHPAYVFVSLSHICFPLSFQELRRQTPGCTSRHNAVGSPSIPPRPLEDRVHSVVESVFDEHHQRPSVELSGSERRSSSWGTRSSSRSSKPPKENLTYEEFCAALEKSSELSELLNLFYDWGMPDLPVPHDTLTPDLLVKEKGSSFLCGKDDSDRPHFLGIPFSSLSGGTRPSSSTTGGAATAAQPLASSSFNKRRASFDSNQHSVHSSTNAGVGPPNSNSNPQSVSHPTSSSKPSVKDDDQSSGSPHVSFSQTLDSNSLGNMEESLPSDGTTSRSASLKSLERGGRRGNNNNANNVTESTLIEEVPIVSGWLYKIGHYFNMKHFRYFVLRDRFLYYYARGSDETPKKVLFMQDVQVSPVCQTENSNAFPFDIVLPVSGFI